MLPVLEEGQLGEATDVKVDAGQDRPDAATNAPPGSFAISGHDRTHAHMIQADPPGRFVIHVDLGLDPIYVWKFDAIAACYPGDPPTVSLPPGDGPRHFHFHPNGRWFYSIQEEGSTLVLFDYDGSRGRLTARQTISTLPPGYAGSNFCSEILVSSDGGFLCGNRLHDSIGSFSVGWECPLTHLRRRMDPRQLSAEFQLRPDRPVPVLLQSAGRHRRRLSRRPHGRPAGVHRALYRGGQPVDIEFLASPTSR